LDDRLLAMDRNRLRLGAGKLDSSTQTSCGVGSRPLGASARRLGLDRRPLAVKQQHTAEWHLWEEDTNLTLSPASAIATFRIRLLWAHGTILTFVALGSAATTTMGWMIGIGPFGFLQQKPLVWVGLIQAYLLMTIIAVLLIRGRSGEYQKVAYRWSTGARSSVDSSLLFVGFVRINGSARGYLDTDYVPYGVSHS
jgi:hypothetical protein